MSDVEKLILAISAHRLDSFRSVENDARRQWQDVLTERGELWHDAGIQLIDSQPDSDLVDHFIYRFEGTTITSKLLAP